MLYCPPLEDDKLSPNWSFELTPGSAGCVLAGLRLLPSYPVRMDLHTGGRRIADEARGGQVKGGAEIERGDGHSATNDRF